MTFVDIVYVGIALLLVLLNAFFVLAEFALVKVRATKIEEIARAGDRRAEQAKVFITHLDQYLSATQLGITIASLGLGWIGEPAFAHIIEPLFRLPHLWSQAASYSLSLAFAFGLLTFLHISVGELAPKSLAIRKPLSSALFVARPMRLFYALFYVPLMILNGASNLILKSIGVDPASLVELGYSQEELRMILSTSQKKGEFSLNRLLLFENLIDLGAISVKDAMVSLDRTQVLEMEAPREESLEVIRTSKYSRYPLIRRSTQEILGIVHVKDIVLTPSHDPYGVDLSQIARLTITLPAAMPLEAALDRMQKARTHMAIVSGAGNTPVGILTMEDILEELVGSIEDEFDQEPRYSLADLIPPGGVFLSLAGTRHTAVIPEMIRAIPAESLGCDPARAVAACLEREKMVSTNMGRGLAIPHARIASLHRPVLLWGRSAAGVEFGPEGSDPVHMIFLLLTPSSQAVFQARILSRIVGIVKSGVIREHLLAAAGPEEILEIIRSGDPHALS